VPDPDTPTVGRDAAYRGEPGARAFGRQGRP
jgi:hypothetical protein